MTPSSFLDQVADWVAGADRITVLTGPGISTDSGIPDLRGPSVVRTKNPEAEKAAAIQHYLADPAVRRAAWQSRLTSAAWEARPRRRSPGPGRARPQRRARGRHHPERRRAPPAAGLDPDRMIEVHGTIHHSICWSCRDRRPMAETLRPVAAGEDDPARESCGGYAVPRAKAAGARVVIVNAQPTEMDASADYVVLGPISEVLPAILR